MMDFRGASWVGDICQKFEAMYLEVEETICEDAVKFVGSQVQNVGSNMKKFYTDVMQDLASPDSTAPDSKVDENKKSGNQEDTQQVGNQHSNDLKVIDQVDGDQVSSLDEDKTVSCTDVKQELASPDSTASDTKTDESKKSLVPEIILEYATLEHMASVGTIFSVKSNALGDLKTCQFTGELVALSDTGKKAVSKTNDTLDLKGGTSNEDTIKLEEGCVFVNENNISFSSYRDGKPRSYKKKMTEALSLKKKLSRRREYKKLVTQYDSVNTSSCLVCVDTVQDTVSPQSNTAELSDWELL